MPRLPIDLKTPQGRQRFYNSREWKAMRIIILTESIYCIKCLEKGIKEYANEIDHIIDIKIRPDLAFVKSNLQALCKACHSKKTIAENSPRKQKYIVVNRKWKNLENN
jgi:5-methylcytosine-specific restriction enzyme A